MNFAGKVFQQFVTDDNASGAFLDISISPLSKKDKGLLTI